jgi:DNA invertase Pin-like site-specific DNA recombinase
MEEQIRIGYARVSSIDDRQKLGLEVQKEALKHCDQLFFEKQSGSDDHRQAFQQSIQLAKDLSLQGKQVVYCVYKMDRLGRKTSTLLQVIEELQEYKIEFVSIKENIDTTTPSGILMYQMLSIMAEFELNNLRQRTKEGLAQAKANGKKLGNQGLPEEKKEKILELYQFNNLSIREIAKRAEVSEKTVYNVAKRHNMSRRRLKKNLQYEDD